MSTSKNPSPGAGGAAEGPLGVEISDTQSHLKVDHAALAALARRVLAEEGVGSASISIALVDDATIHDVNRRHLDHDWATDVISFRLSDEGDPSLSGELVVSAEMAVATAPGVGSTAEDELALYVVHGLLHLCGYDDHAEDDVTEIRRRESEIMAGGWTSHALAPIGPRDAGREEACWSV